MPQTFAAKLEFALKVLSMSRGRLAAEVGVDKSVVGRWVRGAVRPSADDLARLTALVAERAPGVTVLDWDPRHHLFGGGKPMGAAWDRL